MTTDTTKRGAPSGHGVTLPEPDSLASARTYAAALMELTEAHVARALDGIHSVTNNLELLERRRAAIVDAARQTCSRDGFNATSVGDIAKLAGIDKRTLYDYVGTKEDVLFLVFLTTLPRQMRRLVAEFQKDGNAQQILRYLAHEHILHISENPGLVLLSYREMRYLTRPQVDSLLAIINNIVTLFEGVIAWGVTEGTIRSGNPRVSAHALRTMLDIRGLSGWDLRRFTADEVEAAVTSMVFDGLFVETTRTAG